MSGIGEGCGKGERRYGLLEEGRMGIKRGGELSLVLGFKGGGEYVFLAVTQILGEDKKDGRGV